ncbi:phospholipase D-like domain-containing protein [Sphaerothrix gracilis]|uniref:phospholipase D-like domain-containing protein n=1 Tax=Sphaerothrix gracilis TaxID=3151835 RepID=UPI0031FCD8D0
MVRRRNLSKLRWGLFFGIGCLIFLGLNSWYSSSAVSPQLSPLQQDPYIQVYFNHSQANVYTDPYRQIKRQGDNLEQEIIETLAQAQSSIDVAVHELNLPEIAQTLRDRAQAGVRVRVILENKYSRPFYAKNLAGLAERDRQKVAASIALIDVDGNGRIAPAEIAARDAYTILQAAAIPVLDDTADGSKGSGLMHHKFAVIDNRIVLTGSANWTISGIHGDMVAPETRGNANALLRLQSPELAQQFTQEFELMWGDGPQGQTDSLFGLQKPYRAARQVTLPGSAVTVQFSPTSASQGWPASVNGLISKTLASAAQTADLALFVFSDQGIVDQLAQKSEAGIQVRSLIDAEFLYRSYSEGLDMLGVAIPDHRCRYEANNKLWRSPILTVGTPALPPGDKLHHKFAVLDRHTVIIGSQNWSKAANQTNDENLLVIRNAQVAAHFQREFDRLYQKASVGMTAELQQRMRRRKQQCG